MRITDVSFSYGEKKVLDHLCIEWEDNAITAIKAPSGRGKTTLLRILAGVECNYTGKLEVPAPPQTAILFQENRLLPECNVAGQISIVLGKGQDEHRWLEMVGLEKCADMMIHQLSGGMQRRVALARCLAYGADKELLLLDEPFTGVDPETTKMIMGNIRSMGITVLFSAHDAESIELADNVVEI